MAADLYGENTSRTGRGKGDGRDVPGTVCAVCQNLWSAYFVSTCSNWYFISNIQIPVAWLGNSLYLFTGYEDNIK